MADSMLVGLSALWLGILTSISPCPLATNIAAISYIGRSVESPRLVLLNGLLYTLGRTITYLALGVLLVFSLLSAPYVSNALQTHMNQILGPILILVGMFLLELIRFNVGGAGLKSSIAGRADRMGSLGAGLLGMGFALSFCPVSAALFFGSLIPLALKHNSPVTLPALYGIGTAVPVVLFAALVALSARSVGKVFDRIGHIERWARRITGVVFVAVGVYLTVVYIFDVPF
jgi:cytochrome c biogenesis protein CcdA